MTRSQVLSRVHVQHRWLHQRPEYVVLYEDPQHGLTQLMRFGYLAPVDGEQEHAFARAQAYADGFVAGVSRA